MNLNKTLMIMSIVTLVLTIFLVGLVGFWLFYPYKVFSFTTEKIQVLSENKSVKIGGVLETLGNTTNLTEGKEVITTPQIINHSVVNLPSFTYISTKGLFSKVRRTELPDYLPEGTYYLQFNIQVRVNPIRIMNFIRVSEDFHIVK